MRLYLIRHAETIHNLQALIQERCRAGTTNSALTNHGVLQIESLARHFVAQSVNFSAVFASDLCRARLTAEGICRLQAAQSSVTPVLTRDLRERDFGSLEGMSWNSSHALSGSASSSAAAAATHTEFESHISMTQRANSFLGDHLLPLLLDEQNPNHEQNVAIVAHGLILRVLWNRLAGLFDPREVHIAPGTALRHGGEMAVKPVWSNTGFMTVHIQRSMMTPGVATPALSSFDLHQPRRSGNNSVEDVTLPATLENAVPGSSVSEGALLQGWGMTVVAVDSKTHLSGLHRTRGGIGSSAHDSRQKRIDQFFK
ncbi:hypothetical protein N7474_002167 [Penicillium riverlandense]|uniref:uncharacterized protein n=1 Tax=Penicillium riverlandense TaxID=1903569 RepID=UPI0025485F9C|nr:uncharacterized protein N7474_002167 [Penicillium riverlandense]KAJ5833856.1 hypothetical protein N7474_002167 [Penicillium riverlandense]